MATAGVSAAKSSASTAETLRTCTWTPAGLSSVGAWRRSSSLPASAAVPRAPLLFRPAIALQQLVGSGCVTQSHERITGRSVPGLASLVRMLRHGKMGGCGQRSCSGLTPTDWCWQCRWGSAPAGRFLFGLLQH